MQYYYQSSIIKKVFLFILLLFYFIIGNSQVRKSQKEYPKEVYDFLQNKIDCISIINLCSNDKLKYFLLVFEIRDSVINNCYFLSKISIDKKYEDDFKKALVNCKVDFSFISLDKKLNMSGAIKTEKLRKLCEK